MPLKSSATRFGLVARALHWLVALLILALVGIGWYMVGLDYYDPWYHDALTTHRAIGLGVLVVAVLTLAWRGYSPPPDFVPTIRPWERVAARLTHAILYVMMLAIPASGYVVSVSSGNPIPIFDLFTVPAVAPVGEHLREIAIWVHYLLAYGTVGLVGVHVLAALKHHFIDHDDTLRRMAWGARQKHLP